METQINQEYLRLQKLAVPIDSEALDISLSSIKALMVLRQFYAELLIDAYNAQNEEAIKFVTEMVQSTENKIKKLLNLEL